MTEHEKRAQELIDEANNRPQREMFPFTFRLAASILISFMFVKWGLNSDLLCYSFSDNVITCTSKNTMTEGLNNLFMSSLKIFLTLLLGLILTIWVKGNKPNA